jgi:hypothetical protein
MTLAQKSGRILAKTRGLSGATPNATQLIEALRSALEENRREVERLTAERDEARMRMGRILNEIDCRVQHGADSNGHLESVLAMFGDGK